MSPNSSHLRRSLLCLGLCASLACSEDSEQPPGSSNVVITKPASADDFHAQLARLVQRDVCRQLFQCGVEQDAELVVLFGRHIDEAACRNSAVMGALLLEDGREGQAEGLSAGRLLFDADKGLECLSAVDTLLAGAPACDVAQIFKLGEEPEACEQVIRGAVATDGACALDRECAAPGDICQDADLCQGKCVASGFTDACGAGPECGDDAYCRYDDEGAASCVAKVALGQPCDEHSACAGDAICDGELGSATCKAPGSVQVGGACDRSEVCAAGSSCGDDGECVAAALLVGAGADCGLMRGQGLCEPGLVCELDANQRAGKCVPVKGAGADCGSAYECALPLHCSGDTLKCVAPLADGALCSSYLECGSLYCSDEGRCAAPERDEVCVP